MGLKAMTGILLRRPHKDTEKHREEGHMTTEQRLEGGSHRPRSVEDHEQPLKQG